MKFRFTLMAENHGYWKIIEGVDFSRYAGTHDTNFGTGLDALQLFCDSMYFPPIFYEDPVQTIMIEQLSDSKEA